VAELSIATALETALDKSKSAFYSRFQSIFQRQNSFTGEQYAEFAQALLSNLLGGIGYFYGSYLVDSSNQSTYEDQAIKTLTHSINQHTKPISTKPTELFSCVPSRSVFPRGFLWDEGFHQLLVLEWDLDLSIEILQSWLAVMDDRGWIAREYILGPEARSKVPPEFQIMYPHHANPPTLFLVAWDIMEILSGHRLYRGAPSKYLNNKAMTKQLFRELYVKLKKEYLWFRDTQKGNTSSTTLPDGRQPDLYRWRGRTSQHILASGLDDYPRPPPSLGELHVDAASWVGLMAGTLRDMAIALGHKNDAVEFEGHRSAIKASLDSIHWSSESRSYCDTAPREKGFSHVCHLGYVSLMPFLAGMLDHDDPHMADMLDLIRGEQKLWSLHGLRSLSLSDEFYGKDENYWRGPIWININFLVVQRLLVRLISFCR
jgi:mannosyl-oligosaccharide glucosidase